jgi:hypothetical protein
MEGEGLTRRISAHLMSHSCYKKHIHLIFSATEFSKRRRGKGESSESDVENEAVGKAKVVVKVNGEDHENEE